MTVEINVYREWMENGKWKMNSNANISNRMRRLWDEIKPKKYYTIFFEYLMPFLQCYCKISSSGWNGHPAIFFISHFKRYDKLKWSTAFESAPSVEQCMNCVYKLQIIFKTWIAFNSIQSSLSLSIFHSRYLLLSREICTENEHVFHAPMEQNALLNSFRMFSFSLCLCLPFFGINANNSR